jgi:hypothetical protein
MEFFSLEEVNKTICVIKATDWHLTLPDLFPNLFADWILDNDADKNVKLDKKFFSLIFVNRGSRFLEE